MKRDTVNPLKAVGDVNRVRILKMLEERELCVCEVREILDLSNSTVSQHLALLRDADLIVDAMVCRYAGRAVEDLYESVLLLLLCMKKNPRNECKPVLLHPVDDLVVPPLKKGWSFSGAVESFGMEDGTEHCLCASLSLISFPLPCLFWSSRDFLRRVSRQSIESNNHNASMVSQCLSLTESCQEDSQIGIESRLEYWYHLCTVAMRKRIFSNTNTSERS
jgi:DNA-binding transcriptional ArsR family regulator